MARLKLAHFRENLGRHITRPLEPLLVKSGLRPNTLTLLGLGLNLLAAIAISLQQFGGIGFIIGGILVLLAGLFDLLDGALARATKRVTPFGALLDSVVDRLSEAALFLGLLAFYAPWEKATLEVWLIFLALVGSLLVSYVRARSEGLGLQCKVGILTRAERILILALGLLLNQITIALSLIVILTLATTLQRLIFIKQQVSNK